MGVSYEELDGWPQESVLVPKLAGGPGGMKATRHLKCAWADRWTLASELWLSQYPYVSTTPPCACLSFDPMKPLDHGPTQDGVKAVYQYAEVVAHYQTAHITAGGLVITETLDAGFRELPLNPNELLWADDVETVMSDRLQPTVMAPHLVYECRVHNLTAVPAAAISLVGYCNQAVMTAYTFNMTFDTQCLLYLGSRITGTTTVGTTTKYTVTYTMHGRGVSWNMFFRPRDMTFNRIKSRTTLEILSPSPSGDLTQLFS